RLLPDRAGPLVPGLDGRGAVRRVGVRVAAGGRPRRADRRGGRVALQAAAPAARARGAAGPDDDVADLAREAVRAGLHPAVDADGARDAGAQRHEQEPVGAPARADAALGEAAGADVVAEGDGHAAEPFGEQRAQGEVAPAEVGRVDGEALPLVDDAGHGEARRGGGPSVAADAVGTQFGGEVEDAGDDGFGAAVAAGGPARLVQQFAARTDQGGLHPGAAHVEGDDMFHGDSVTPAPGRGLVHLRGVDLIPVIEKFRTARSAPGLGQYAVQRRVRTRAIAVVSALGLTAVLGGCGGDGSSDVTLKLVAADYGDSAATSSRKYWADLVEEFEAGHPGVKVDVSVYSWNDVDRKVKGMVDAGDPPDLAQIGAYADYAKKDLLYKAGPLLSIPVQADFVPQLADAGEIPAGQFGLPFASSTRVLFYNKDLFDEAGITPPKTWEELADNAEALKAD